MFQYEAAEMVKLVDNTYRDVTFAFANEVARACELFDVSANEVINYGKLGYPRTNVPLPGLVGGPCLEKDPHIFSQSVKARGFELEITNAARLVNERQPKETVFFIRGIALKRMLPEKLKIALLGLAFKGKPETDDLRGSMSLKVLEQLKKTFKHASIVLYDPLISSEQLALGGISETIVDALETACENAGIVIIANNHPMFSYTAQNFAGHG